MYKFTIVYPGGAGGTWLSNLIHCLETNEEPGTHNGMNNFHHTKKSKQVQISHDPQSGICVFLSGTAIFNIYLNWITKLLTYHDLKDKSIRDSFELLASFTSHHLFLLDQPVDINFNWMLTDDKKFCDNLFEFLDKYNVDYVKDIDKIKQALTNYRLSCAKPNEYYDNFDNIYWLGWCNGICKHVYQDWPMVDSLDEMKNFLLPRREFFKEYTAPLMVDIQ